MEEHFHTAVLGKQFCINVENAVIKTNKFLRLKNETVKTCNSIKFACYKIKRMCHLLTYSETQIIDYQLLTSFLNFF